MNKIERDGIIAFHPGYYLKDILDEGEITPEELSNMLNVPTNTVSELVDGSVDLTNDMATRLADMFETSVDLWLNLNQTYIAKKSEIEQRRNISKE